MNDVGAVGSGRSTAARDLVDGGYIVERDPSTMRVRVVMSHDWLPTEGQWHTVREGGSMVLGQATRERLYREMAANLLLDVMTLACVAAQDDCYLVALDIDPDTCAEVRADLPEAFDAVGWSVGYHRTAGTQAATHTEVAAAIAAGRYAAVLALPMAGRYAGSPLLGAVEAAAYRMATGLRDRSVRLIEMGEVYAVEVDAIESRGGTSSYRDELRVLMPIGAMGCPGFALRARLWPRRGTVMGMSTLRLHPDDQAGLVAALDTHEEAAYRDQAEAA